MLIASEEKMPQASRFVQTTKNVIWKIFQKYDCQLDGLALKYKVDPAVQMCLVAN